MAELTMAQKRAIALANARARAAGKTPGNVAPPPDDMGPPAGAKPGSKEYAQWAVSQVKAGKTLRQASPTPPAYQPPNTGPLDQIAAGYTSAVNAVPIAGPTLLKGIEGVRGQVQGMTPEQVSAETQATEQANPAASMAGTIAGTTLPFLAGGEIPLVAKGLGMAPEMGLGARTLFSAGSNAAIGGADAAMRGQDPVAGAALGGTVGAVAPGAGDLFGKWVSGLSRGTQNRIVDAAIKGGPTSAQEVRDAGSQLFKQAYGDEGGPMIVSPALERFWNSVQGATAKFRPNAANDPQAVGLLSHVQGLIDASKQAGTVVDLQDLHLARQLASQVARSPGRDGTIGSIVVNKIDDFVRSLKPADILGGANPNQAANALMGGISTWNRAVKAGIIERAIEQAQGYKSGLELGLKSTFSNLMKSKDWSRFSQVEKDAIEQVAKGKFTQNVASLFGKMGISIGGHGAHNIVGAGVGTVGLTAGLTPFLGPLAFPAAAATTTAAGAIGRRVAETAAQRGAQRAVRVVAAPDLPQTLTPAVNQWGPSLLQALTRGVPLAMVPAPTYAATSGRRTGPAP